MPFVRLLTLVLLTKDKKKKVIPSVHNHSKVSKRVYTSRDSVVGEPTACGLDDRGSEFEVWRSKEFSIVHIIQTRSRPQVASYRMGTRVKAAGA
jgi:hypothetical protein